MAKPTGSKLVVVLALLAACPFVSLLSLGALGAGSAGCGSRSGDEPADAGTPSPIGSGFRISDVLNPKSPHHPNTDGGSEVTVTGASVLWIDTYDETMDGKSRGTVYVQDVGSQAQYSGCSLYSPTYFPSSLSPAPGDVLDLTGEYEELGSIGTAVFTPGDPLPQIAKPQATFRFEYKPPQPVVIDGQDLETYATGRKWLNMLVTVKNVTLAQGFEKYKGRTTAPLTADTGKDGAQISDELTEIDVEKFPPCMTASNQGEYCGQGIHFASVTGVVTYFFNFHVAPRTLADLVRAD
jgi:hypothetical protein